MPARGLSKPPNCRTNFLFYIKAFCYWLKFADFIEERVWFATIVTISGHLHLADRVKYLNVDYFCNGAASGAWWNGKNQEFAPSYALIDFYSDGSVRRTLKQYDWKA